MDSTTPNPPRRLAVAGSGAIACGLAATAAHHGPVLLLARSRESAERAQATVEKTLDKLGAEIDPDHVQIVTDPAELGAATFVVEAVVEDIDVKARLLGELDALLGERAILASTTSSLSVAALAEASGRPDRFVGLHVFNPVTRMQLVELIFPEAASEDTRARSVSLCETFEKVPVEVPDVPGFVVNRLLFPYLFSAVRLVEETGMSPQDVDTCMRLGAGHPMGPLALLDLVGLDVSKAIGETIGAEIPRRLDELVAEGSLGRKSGRGFHGYDRTPA
ncbi:MAG TPA: 3-hydroxyacyl-CoA dehydrogenase family protein [Solirubrobacteraceae bacterium]|jgi:3-hydroxybutyryl-CoA dehydrogenase|nr:3-hydroxyacyl-CoA dehydrogenase family protein [Solirubrobacteraceae bacterium]